ncbi:MAG: glycoside hydrolase family 18 protein [Deltaproteobacteria bacterium]|nr:glycoside hydrolase family 18 protein [Deltaproteobacteria bacterium]
MTRRRRTLAALGLLLAATSLLTACGSSGSGPPPAGDGISAVFNEIYDGDFDANNANAPYERFDIVYVAFAHIDRTTHALDFEAKVGKQVERERLAALKANTAELRAAGALKLVISLGWGEQEQVSDDDQTPLLEAYIDEVAPSIRRFVDEYELDGFDIDYETPRFTSAAKFREVAQKVRAALGDDYLFTITPNNTDQLDGAALRRYFDYVNAQSYNADMDSDFSVGDLTRIGVPAAMIVAGADIENVNHYQDDANRVAWAINQYDGGRLAGVFIWQLKPAAQLFPGGRFVDYADQVWNATHP